MCCRYLNHLVRRGAGAEDEALGEAVPVELGKRAVTCESCDEEHSGEEPLRRHYSGHGTRALLRERTACSVLPPDRPGAGLLLHSQSRLLCPIPFIDGAGGSSSKRYDLIACYIWPDTSTLSLLRGAMRHRQRWQRLALTAK